MPIDQEVVKIAILEHANGKTEHYKRLECPICGDCLRYAIFPGHKIRARCMTDSCVDFEEEGCS